MSVAEGLLAELAREPTPERYLVYADLLQTEGDPRGELIALAVHAETTGAITDRQRALEAQIAEQLTPAAARGGLQLVWERGFVRDVEIGHGVMPAIAEHCFAHPAFRFVRSIGAHDILSNLAESPLEQIAKAPFARSIERFAFGHEQSRPPSDDELAMLIVAMPRLRDLELRSNLKAPSIDALERCTQLERVALWASCPAGPLLERLIYASWPNLRALAMAGPIPPYGQLPSFLAPLLDGDRHPALEHLSLLTCEFEAPLIQALARRPLGKRLRTLGLSWFRIDDEVLRENRETFANLAIVWPRPFGGEPPNGDQDYTLARLYRVGLERCRDAVPHAERACELAPHQPYHWSELAITYGRLDRLEDKVRAMDHAISTDPKLLTAYFGRASALRDLSRFDEAEQTLRAAIEKAPDQPNGPNALGALYARCGRSHDAIAQFARAAELADGERSVPYLCNEIEVHLELGALEKVSERLATARAIAPDHLPSGRLTGYLRLREGAPEDVLRLVEAMISRATEESQNLGCHALRAAASRDLGRANDADRSYQRIVDKAVCPAWIALAWLGQTIAGKRDPFAEIATHAPEEIADAIAAFVNVGRSRLVHDTIDRTDDRIHAAACAIAAAAVAGRADEARTRARAFHAYLAGPAPVKHNESWFDLAELMRVASLRAPDLAEVIETTYRVATGRRAPDP